MRSSPMARGGSYVPRRICIRASRSQCGWPKDRLATVHNDPVSVTTEICERYYRLTRTGRSVLTDEGERLARLARLTRTRARLGDAR